MSKKYGKLTIIKSAGKNKRSQKLVECRCDCGNTKVVLEYNLKSGNTTSCGCASSRKRSIGLLDLTDHRFGKLVALKISSKSKKSNKTIWECRCDCGNTTTVTIDQLRSGKTKSCGCLRHKIPDNAIDLIGNKYGRLTVIDFAGTSKWQERTWLCKCECGKQLTVRGIALRTRKTQSCGCLLSDFGKNKLIDITGNVFGNLTVLYRTENNKHKQTQWVCRCHCGELVTVTSNQLRMGRTRSCGCLLSSGEAAIAKRLRLENIPYKRERSIKGCISDKGVKLRFDFLIYDNKGNLLAIIEYDGLHHFEPVDFGSKGKLYAKHAYEDVKRRDEIKNNFAKSLGVPLIRVPYTIENPGKYVVNQLSLLF